MRKFKHITALLAIIFFIAPSCSDDFLETKPLTEISEVDLWGDPALSRNFINHIYFGLPEPFRRGRLTSNVVDEADYRGNTGSTNFNRGVITQDATPAWTSMYYGLDWASIYSNIRYCNNFLGNVEKIPFAADELANKDKMIGEVHFLRAFLYHTLVVMYGGVPLVKEAYTLTDDFNIPRSSYDDCIKFIVEDCDLAAAKLPTVHSGDDIGRATKGAALALKARALLYAASDLHNTNAFSSFSNPELLGYTTYSASERTARWTAAKNAAKAVMDLNMYDLYKAEPAAGDSIADNYANYFLIRNYTVEDIWNRFFVVQNQQMIGLYSGPNGYHGWGTNAPTGNMVDAFEMKDGSKFDWTNPAHAAAPYQNRDQRFYATILYEGAGWRQRPGDVASRDPKNKIQVGTWEKWENGALKLVYGLDTRKGGVEEWNGSYTGYYMRKFVDPAFDVSFIEAGGGGYQYVPYRFFRFAEALLNYAEACIELGEYGEAMTSINRVRRRAGQPELSGLSGDELRQRYRNERRIELAFEDHRILDVRRWLAGPDGYLPVTQAVVVYKLQPDNTTAEVPTITHKVFQSRSWLDKAYFMPIARAEISKNADLVQNPGY
jgi:starch-binding outer membrane protein, SusD/RagB family